MKIVKNLLTAIALCGATVTTAQAMDLTDPNQQTVCMALNIYYEARSDNLAGKFAVADVVLNRVESRRYPNNICDVVKQGYRQGKRSCQFSWYCDGKSDVPQDHSSWMDALYIAVLIQDGQFRGISEGATHYHATYVNPKWNKNMHPIGRIGAHKFFRETTR